jgi:hypothetical protein
MPSIERFDTHTAGALLAIVGGTLAVLASALPLAGVATGTLDSSVVTIVAGLLMLVGGGLLFASR